MRAERKAGEPKAKGGNPNLSHGPTVQRAKEPKPNTKSRKERPIDTARHGRPRRDCQDFRVKVATGCARHLVGTIAKVGEGRTIGTYRSDQIVFSQGGPADAVFYLQNGKVRSPSFRRSSRLGKSWMSSAQAGSWAMFLRLIAIHSS